MNITIRSFITTHGFSEAAFLSAARNGGNSKIDFSSCLDSCARAMSKTDSAALGITGPAIVFADPRYRSTWFLAVTSYRSRGVDHPALRLSNFFREGDLGMQGIVSRQDDTPTPFSLRRNTELARFIEPPPERPRRGITRPRHDLGR